MKIEQILPDILLEDIPLKKAICIRIEKKLTGEIIKFLKDYIIDYEKSAFYLDSKYFNNYTNENEKFKFGKFNIKNKNIVYKEHDKTKLESKIKFDFNYIIL